jgi:hypothetical protein
MLKAQRFTLAMPAWVTVDEIGRVDPSVNDSSTPSARLQIALQKRPLIDCQSGYDFADGNLNLKVATTAGAMCSRVILRVFGWLSSRLLALARKLRRRSPTSGRMPMKMGISPRRWLSVITAWGRTR